MTRFAGGSALCGAPCFSGWRICRALLMECRHNPNGHTVMRSLRWSLFMARSFRRRPLLRDCPVISGLCDYVIVSGFWWWLRELDLNQRPSGYEPDELPGCSIPRYRFHDPLGVMSLVSSAGAPETAKGLPLRVSPVDFVNGLYPASTGFNAWRRPTLPTLER